VSVVLNVSVNFGDAANVEAAEAAVENCPSKFRADMLKRQNATLTERFQFSLRNNLQKLM